jgi:hypothetical protein
MAKRTKDGGRVWKLICEQEKMLLAEVDAIRVSGKPEVIGALFEEEFRAFLTRLMPASISVVPGFIVEENGRDSSHFDALLIDNSHPFLGSIGPHRYVMSASVVAAIELTTRLDADKLNMVIGKSEEVRRISGEHYEPGAFGSIGFYTVCADCQLSGEKIKSEFRERKPEGVLCALRRKEKSSGFVAWMEGGRDGTAMCLASKSPLADFVSMHLQDALYALSARNRDVNTIGQKMNRYIHWGTARDNGEPG